MTESDIRWQQRFQNFEKAVDLLSGDISRGADALSDLEKRGIIQTFELTFELAWKTMKDFLIFNGMNVSGHYARGVIKEAFATEIINDGQVWIDMLEHRNLMSHTYDQKVFDEVVQAVEDRYLGAIEDFCSWLKNQMP